MTPLRRLITIACLIAAPAAYATEKRAAPPPIPGVPRPYWSLFRGGITADEVAGFRAKLPYESITLVRTPCYGACPAFTLTLHRSGRAEMHAARNLPQTGDYIGEIDALTFGRLCYVLDHDHFQDLQDTYQPSPRWTDDATCIVTARCTDANHAKSVSDYGTVGPIELWTIQQLLDGLRERIAWKPK